MDYGTEFDKIKAGSGSTFKPELGQYNIEIVAEPEETVYDDGEKKTPQLKIAVKVNDGEQQNWYIGKGSTLVSAYGQLMTLGKKHGKLEGVKFQLLVQQAKDRKQYTIPEALTVMQEMKKAGDSTPEQNEALKLMQQTPTTQ